MNRFAAIGSSLAFVGIALGAFGTHGLKDRLTPTSIEIWKTAVQYHLIHAVALVLVGVLASTNDDRKIQRAGWLMTAGVVIFSGSLYALALTDVKTLGAITPIGGVCFLVAWAMLAFTFGRRQ